MLVAARPDTGGDGSSSSSTEEGAAAALPRATVVDGRFILTKEDFPDAAAADDELISGASGTSSRGYGSTGATCTLNKAHVVFSALRWYTLT